MKNVLFVGPYRQTDGWGNAAKEYIRALRLTDCNLTVRPVYLNSQGSYDKFKEFDDLEKARYDNYDVIIQNTLPHLFRKYGDVETIGLSYFETTVRATPWPENINTLDVMWVSSEFEKKLLIDSGVTTPIKVVSIPCDEEKYKREYEFPLIQEGHSHEYKFYFVGEYVTRKNINALLLAFHREFTKNEQVRLVLKLNRVGLSDEQTLELSTRGINEAKKSMGIYGSDLSKYKSEIIITKYLSQEELYGLHCECDCFVMPSSGEAFCIPAFDAAMFGSSPIVNKNSSMSEYIHPFVIESTKTPAIAEDRPLPFLYSGLDTWYKVDPISLQYNMRYVYEQDMSNKETKRKRREYTLTNILPRYTYKSVAERMGI